MMPNTVQVIRFGSFELDPARYSLRQRGRPVRLSSSLMELLLLLVSRPGELVTREQIIAALWSEPNAVDVRQGVNTAVARLRAALDDNPASPRYIETVIGRGYRFVGEIEKVPLALAPGGAGTSPLVDPADTTDAASDGAAHKSPANVATVQSPANGNGRSAPRREVVFGSSVQELHETALGRAPGAGPGVGAAHMKARRSRALFLLVAAAVTAVSLGMAYRAWLNRQVPEPVPASAHRQITTNDAEHPVSVAAISPDGNLLAYMDTNGIFLQDLGTGRTRLIPGPPPLKATRLLWFADQSRLLLTGFAAQSDQPEIWTLSASGDAARLFRRNAGDGAPAPDGLSIAFTVENGRELHMAAADGGAERLVTRSREGELLSTLFWSPDSRRISFQQRGAAERPGTQIEFSYVWSYHSIEVTTGQETAAVTDISFDSAGETDDGTLYYLRTRPAVDTAHTGMWVVRTDQRTGAFLAKPKRLTAFGRYELWSGMTLSRAGKLSAIGQQSQQNIYYGELDASGRQLIHVSRLTTKIATDCPHSWSLDGKTVYFESDRVGSMFHLFRQSIGSANAEMLTVGERQQFFPLLMADGKTLVYEEWARSADGRYARAIYRASADGSEPKLVWNEDELDEWRCPETPGGNCVLRKIEAQRLFTFYALKVGPGSESGRGPELAFTAWQPNLLGDWTLSPDGKTAAIPNHDAEAPTIRLVALDGSQRETVIKVHQEAQLSGLHWASDGNGFFAELRSGAMHRLEYVSLAGEVSVVRETEGNSWGIPSRNGKELAFVDTTQGANVFLWQ